jgi:pSer/pThr/pTyr-binding forkhead associated (FHA) protein
VKETASLTRVRLTYGDRTVNLLPGNYLIGRGPQCHIVLDDPRVSRAHARLTVDGAGVAIEDIGSANGVYINGDRIAALVRMKHGDGVVIGDQELWFEVAKSEQRRPPRDTIPEDAPLKPADYVAEDVFSTARADALEMLGGVAERALAAGEPGQAETVIHARLAEVLNCARARQPVHPDVAARALRIALELGRQLRARRWIDYAIDLLTVLGVPCSPELVRHVRAARAVTGPPDPGRLAAYARCVRALPMSLDKVRTVALVDELSG